MCRVPCAHPQARGFEGVYTGVITKAVEMEERNIFCGAYNILLLTSRCVEPVAVQRRLGLLLL